MRDETDSTRQLLEAARANRYAERAADMMSHQGETPSCFIRLTEVRVRSRITLRLRSVSTSLANVVSRSSSIRGFRRSTCLPGRRLHSSYFDVRRGRHVSCPRAEGGIAHVQRRLILPPGTCEHTTITEMRLPKVAPNPLSVLRASATCIGQAQRVTPRGKRQSAREAWKPPCRLARVSGQGSVGFKTK